MAGDQFLLTSDGVAGFLDARHHLGTVEAEADAVAVRAMFDGVPLAARRRARPRSDLVGRRRPRHPLQRLRLALGPHRAGARMNARAPLGWCSWYQYFADVTPADVRSNLEAIAGRGFEVVQIDDGYQRAIGDWLTTCDAWSEGLAPLIHEIQHAGLQPGIWTAPFLAAADSEVLAKHPDWTSTHAPTGYPSKAAYNPGNWGGWALALDTTRPDVLDHLRETYAALTAQGFEYHKIDFCYAASLPARRHDPTKTRAESLRLGLDAVRDGIGDESFLLGCGCPFGPAVGVVDAMRVSADVAPVWAPDGHWPGLYEAAPAAVNAIAASVLRAPLHRRLFINDPDCLLLRPSDTRLDAAQRSFLAAVITGTGAFTLVSDDMRRYSDAEWGLLEALRSVHDDVDTLLDIDDPFADPIVVRSAAGTTLTVDWRSRRARRTDRPAGHGGVVKVVARAPGRVNLIGDHTDYTGGLVLPMAIDRWTEVELERGVPWIELVSGDDEEPAILHLDDPRDPATVRPPWARYVAGVVDVLRPESGGVGYVRTDVPIGAGLSSSAALEVALALALGFEGTPLELATACQRAEQVASGVPCGIMDQLASAAGVEGSALLIDCTTLSVTPVPIPDGVDVVVVDSGTRRQLTTSFYGVRRAQCEEAEVLVGPLRDASLEDIEAIGHDDLRARARHVVSENRRVRDFASALTAGDLSEAGALMFESHASLRDDFDVSTPALDDLVDALTGRPGVHGARLTGAGFGGCAVALVDADAPPIDLGAASWVVRASAGATVTVLD